MNKQQIEIKVNRKSLAVNENVVSDALIFMLCAYYEHDHTTFYFWNHLFQDALISKAEQNPMINSWHCDNLYNTDTPPLHG